MAPRISAFIVACVPLVHGYQDVGDGLLLLMHPSAHSCTRNKTLHLIRHGQGTHNAAEESAAELKLHLRDPAHQLLHAGHGTGWILLEGASGRRYFDPPLTPAGRDQAYALRTKLRQDSFRVDAIVSSPFRRTLQTALLSLPQLEAAATTFDLGEPVVRRNPTYPWFTCHPSASLANAYRVSPVAARTPPSTDRRDRLASRTRR